MDTPMEEVYTNEKESISVLFKIISRRSWDEFQKWHRALPGSCVEHLMHGLYVLHVKPGGASRLINKRRKAGMYNDQITHQKLHIAD